MAPYSVTISGNQVADIRKMPDEDYDELGLEWALSELKDTYRHAKRVDATFSLGDRAELGEFLAAVKKLLGSDAVTNVDPQLLQE